MLRNYGWEGVIEVFVVMDRRWMFRERDVGVFVEGGSGDEEKDVGVVWVNVVKV